MKIALILTNDWELFGDGSGDYFSLQHKPMIDLLDRLKNTLDGSGKITLMAEVAQQLAHLQSAELNNKYKEIAVAWEELCTKAIKQGSDVQLHLHPQWFDYKADKDKFNLNMQNTIFGKLSDGDIEKELRAGKEYLENLLIPIDKNYKCKVFRAGAYYIEPSKNVIKNLQKLGFAADTSVTKGFRVADIYDYTDAYSDIMPWRVSIESVKYKGNEKLLEFPIASISGLDSDVIRKYFPAIYYKLKFAVNVRMEEIQWLAKRDEEKQKLYPKENRFYKKNEKKNLNWLISKFLRRSSIQLDYDYLPASIFVEQLKKIHKKYEAKGNIEYLPVVASGHIKDAYDNANMFRILDKIEKEANDKIEFWTMSEAVDYVNAKEN